jgi:acylphosphatase
MSEMIRRRVLIAGRVQGVGYRAACARVAAGLGVRGYVRNLDDGRVEVAVAGPVDAVEQLIEWCRLGPRVARVDGVVVANEPISSDDTAEDFFELR